jgi:heterodisulfide reductase subunit A
LAEKESSLGGQVSKLDRLFPSGDRAGELLQAKLDELKRVQVEVMTSAEIESIDGFVGNFEVKIDGKELKVGAIVLATGGVALDPEGRLGYGKFSNVITSSDFEKTLQGTDGFDSGKQIVFVQCVGAREKEGYTGCSRYCCHVSLKQAREAVKRGARATIVHRDVRAFTRYGEGLYRQARDEGIRFLRRGDDAEVKVQGNGTAETVSLFDETLLSDVTLNCDLVVLAVPMLPSGTAQPLAEMLRIPLGSDGFYLEKHVKLGPLETNTEGIFLCGCSQYPKDIPDSLAQASGVAAKVGALLSRPYVTLDPTTATVERELCRACGSCVAICEYNAPSIVEEDGEQYAVINEALCKGCGTCASHCPSGAIIARHFTDEQIESMIDILFAEQA